MPFSIDHLERECVKEADRFCDAMRQFLREQRPKGAVLGLWGGIDSSVTAAAGPTRAQVEDAFNDIDTSRCTTRYQHLKPILMEEIVRAG